MPRFPTRTLVLMVLALLSFTWMWWSTHRARLEAPPEPVQVRQLSGPGTIGPLPAVELVEVDGGRP